VCSAERNQSGVRQRGPKNEFELEQAHKLGEDLYREFTSFSTLDLVPA
jgi:hypothetical protein